MKKAIMLSFVLAIACVFAGAAMAETVKGSVSKVDKAGKKIEVSKTNATTGAAEVVLIDVNDATGYTGVTTIDEVKEGNKVTIEAVTDATGKGWTAKSVAVEKE